jgi:hypothetical protein
MSAAKCKTCRCDLDLSPRVSRLFLGGIIQKNENSELDIYGRTNPMKGIISRKSETLLIYENRVIK